MKRYFVNKIIKASYVFYLYVQNYFFTKDKKTASSIRVPAYKKFDIKK